MTAELEKKVDKLLEVTNKIESNVMVMRTQLYSNPDMPGAVGDIPEIKTHLCRINGRLTDGDRKLSAHAGDIKMLKDRWKWAKWIASGSAGVGGLSGLGVLIKKLIGG